VVDKYLSDVVNDKRFRAALNRVSKSDWKKIAERLAVTNGSIQVRDGFFFGEGCMSHRYSTDQAAFVINEATGKGAVAYRDSGNIEHHAGATTVFAWREMPLSDTPIAGWARESGAVLDVSNVGATSACRALVASDKQKRYCSWHSHDPTAKPPLGSRGNHVRDGH
jgi:hypothetical protein